MEFRTGFTLDGRVACITACHISAQSIGQQNSVQAKEASRSAKGGLFWVAGLTRHRGGTTNGEGHQPSMPWTVEYLQSKIKAVTGHVAHARRAIPRERTQWLAKRARGCCPGEPSWCGLARKGVWWRYVLPQELPARGPGPGPGPGPWRRRKGGVGYPHSPRESCSRRTVSSTAIWLATSGIVVKATCQTPQTANDVPPQGRGSCWCHDSFASSGQNDR